MGSGEDLREKSGYTGDLTDLHRDKVDHITIPSKQGKGELKRIDEVFDCWFESGSMPYASSHYPFENEEQFKASFPGDFISEGLDQTRGWFYTLCVLGTHLFGHIPFQNCVVTGIVLAEDGKKMSKRLKNYPDPTHVMDNYGSDALRLYLINSPVVRAETLRFKETGVREIVAKVLLPLWNSYRFFEDQVALLHKTSGQAYTYDPAALQHNENVMDRWILASCQSLLQFVHTEMAAYRLYTVVPRLLSLIDNTTNWYIRFNRRRLKGEFGHEECLHALHTLCEVLFTLTRGLAPFTPFITDTIYLRLLPHLPTSILPADHRSVHFLPYPSARTELFDPDTERRVTRMQSVIELARISRERRTIGLKTPLKTLIVLHTKPQYLEDIRSLQSYITAELNVRDIILSSDEAAYNVRYSVTADWPVLGRKLKKDAQRVKKALPALSSADVKAFADTGNITVDGIALTSEDLVVKREVAQAEGMGHMEANGDDEVLTILDTAMDEGLAAEGVAREVVNRIQRLRKKAGLKTTDDVGMEYAVGEDPEGVGLEGVIEGQKSLFERVLRRPVEKAVGGGVNGDGEGKSGVALDLGPGEGGGKTGITRDVDAGAGTGTSGELIAEEEQEIQKARLLLRLVRL